MWLHFWAFNLIPLIYMSFFLVVVVSWATTDSVQVLLLMWWCSGTHFQQFLWLLVSLQASEGEEVPGSSDAFGVEDYLPNRRRRSKGNGNYSSMVKSN